MDSPISMKIILLFNTVIQHTVVLGCCFVTIYEFVVVLVFVVVVVDVVFCFVLFLFCFYFTVFKLLLFFIIHLIS